MRLLFLTPLVRARGDLVAAGEHLRTVGDGGRSDVAIVGFCMGGMLALSVASLAPGHFQAAVDFYGVHPRLDVDLTGVTMPVQAHFGIRDPHVPIASARYFVERARVAGVNLEVHEYDTGHAFFNDARTEVYSQPDAALAWQRTLAFLDRWLGPRRGVRRAPERGDP